MFRPTLLALSFALSVNLPMLLAAEEVTGAIDTTVQLQVHTNYLVVLPDGYDATTKYPLIVFLHGIGERGDDIHIVARSGGPIEKVKELGLKVILVAPQCEKDKWWNADALDAVFDKIVADYPIDLSRIYLTGLSMGGFGTWDYITRHPGRVAAAIPIAGGGDPTKVAAIKDLPIWAFHGAKDNTVKIEKSQAMVDALKALGSKVEFTIYPEGGHSVWNEAYADPKLYEWLLAQRK